MSLLMKALEKAAKEREEGGRERAAATAAAPSSAATAANGGSVAKTDFTLEPLGVQKAATSGAREPTLSPVEPTISPRKPAPAMPPNAPKPPSDPARAATVMQAGKNTRGSAVAEYLRDHPWLIIGTVAALFLLGYFTYVYLQVKNPAMFAKTPPPAAQPAPRPAPAVPAPAATAPDAAAIPQTPGPAPLPGAAVPSTTTSITAGTTPIPAASVLSGRQESAGKERESGSIKDPPPVEPAGPPARKGKTRAPVFTAVPTGERAARDSIRVTGGSVQPAINPLLSSAYSSLNEGNFEASQRLYQQLLRSEPTNVDAMLGLAAIASQQGDSDQASRHYMRLLELDPRNSLAQAGLISMLGRADPLAAESRLKILIGRDPSAYLYFTLGNLYADQNRWPDAQQAYFQAYHLQPDNPDYAYNLAVGLEHVSQPKLALNFYRRALQLTSTNSRANFSGSVVQERISKLERIAE